MARLNLKPLDDRIVVEQNVAEERTAGGILLPDNAKEKPTRGKVMATGNRAPICVRVGDEVIYGKYSGTEVEVTGKKYTVLRESDVLAVVEK